VRDGRGAQNDRGEDREARQPPPADQLETGHQVGMWMSPFTRSKVTVMERESRPVQQARCLAYRSAKLAFYGAESYFSCRVLDAANTIATVYGKGPTQHVRSPRREIHDCPRREAARKRNCRETFRIATIAAGGST